MQDFLKTILKAVQVELTDEFDSNFERKAFFNESWNQPNLVNNRGSMMARTNGLRRSLRSRVSGNSITFSSSLPYASLHNEGGEVVVTQKMKSFFWAMFYKSYGAISFSIKKKAMANTERNKRLSTEAAQWKALALQKVGAKMKIEKRQFIGDHPKVRLGIEKIVNEQMQKMSKTLFKK
jgi:phage gpG-like protein